MSDTWMEQAIDDVLSRYGIPLFGLVGGADRGDLASDIAEAVRDAAVKRAVVQYQSVNAPRPTAEGVAG